MKEILRLAVPLNKVQAWRVNCKCGGHTDIASGVIVGLETARCRQCKTQFPMEDLEPALKAIRKLCVAQDKGFEVSAVILEERCKKEGTRTYRCSGSHA